MQKTQKFKSLFLFCPAMLLLSACSSDTKPETDTAAKQNTTAVTANTGSNSPNATTSGKRNTYLDSSVRGYVLEGYTRMDSFSAAKKERTFPGKKPFVRTTYKFDTEKVYYNTGVTVSEFTAIVGGFNTGTYQVADAPMDGIVVRMIPENGYWFVQANVASGYIKERMTVDVLFIRNEQVETVAQ